MEPNPERLAYLTEAIFPHAKYLVNMHGRVDEQVVVDCASDVILGQHADFKAFQAYKNDKDLLKSEIKASIALLEDGGLLARHPEARNQLISPYSQGTDEVVAYVGPSKGGGIRGRGRINL